MSLTKLEKIAKNLISDLMLARLAQICHPPPPQFFHAFYLYLMLDIVASYHCIQFQGKLMIQTQENDKKTHLRPDLGWLDPNLGRQVFLITLYLNIVLSYHPT